MSGTPRVSVVIPVIGDPRQLRRLMAGLSVQTLDHAGLEVRLAHDGHLDLKHAALWSWMLRPARLMLDRIPRTGNPEADADQRTTLLLAGLRRARGLVLLPLFPNDRLHPRALEALAETLKEPGLAHGNWLRLGPLPGLQRGSSCASRLKRRNDFGPRPALSREVIEAGVRPRPGLPLGWDLAVQAVQSDFPLLKTSEHLMTLTPSPPVWKDQEEERGRARLVTANPSFFAPATLAWALAVLRREAWALGSSPGRIPQPREAARLKDRHVRAALRRERSQPSELPAGLLLSDA